MGVKGGKVGVVRMPPVIHQFANKSSTPYTTSSHAHAHVQAVTRCDLAVNGLVLDMKVNM